MVVTSDVTVSHVTFSAQELVLRLNQHWSFLVIDNGQVRVHGEPLAHFAKRGPRVVLTPMGPREVVRWIAWAIQSICPDAEAEDPDASPSRITDEPLTAEAVEQAARDIMAARLVAIAKEADPAGGAHQAVVLVTYLVKKGLLDLAGPTASVARAIAPLLNAREVDDTIGTKLEDLLLDLDEVDELYADADELSRIVHRSDHIFDR